MQYGILEPNRHINDICGISQIEFYTYKDECKHD